MTFEQKMHRHSGQWHGISAHGPLFATINTELSFRKGGGMDLSIAIRKTKNELVGTLNRSGLPYDIMGYILKEIQQDVQTNAETYYRNALEQERIREEQERARQEQEAAKLAATKSGRLLVKSEEELEEERKQMESEDPEAKHDPENQEK